MKQVYRLYEEDGTMMADLIEKEDATPDASQPILGHHPYLVGVRKRYEAIARIEPLLQPVLRQGARVAEQPSLPEIRARSRELLQRLHPTSRRLLNPHVYKVSVGPALYELAERLREEAFPGP
jgi:nicotinate phosphoribosyltransferase